jgi:transcriptional regulator with XRE-family HTH domain
VATAKDLPRDIGEFIRDLRRNARISLRQLAEQAGVSNPYLSQIERGLSTPRRARACWPRSPPTTS